MIVVLSIVPSNRRVKVFRSNFETVFAGFFNAHAFHTGFRKLAHAAKNLARHIFRGGHDAPAKFRDLFVEILAVECVHDLAFDERIEIAQVGNHSGGGIDRPGDGHLDHVVMPVPVRIAALAI